MPQEIKDYKWVVRATKGGKRISFILEGKTKADIKKELDYTLNHSWQVIDILLRGELAKPIVDPRDEEIKTLKTQNEDLAKQVSEEYDRAETAEYKLEAYLKKPWWERIFFGV